VAFNVDIVANVPVMPFPQYSDELPEHGNVHVIDV